MDGATAASVLTLLSDQAIDQVCAGLAASVGVALEEMLSYTHSR